LKNGATHGIAPTDDRPIRNKRTGIDPKGKNPKEEIQKEEIQEEKIRTGSSTEIILRQLIKRKGKPLAHDK
jgi:hypothetical protein